MAERPPIEQSMVDDLHKIISKDKQLHDFWHILPDSGRDAVENGYLELMWQMILGTADGKADIEARKNTMSMTGGQRAYAQTLRQFTTFITFARMGKAIEFHGLDWVAMDRKSYDELRKKAADKYTPPKNLTIDEALDG